MPDDAAKLVLTCTCGQRMKVPGDALGKAVTCIKCKTKVAITKENTSPAAPAAPSSPAREAPARDEAPTAGDDEPPKPPPFEALEDGALAQVFVEQGLVDAAKLEEARLVKQDLPRNEWELLVDLGHVSQTDFHAFMVKQANVANIDLKNYDIPTDVVEFVPEDIVKGGLVFPVDRLGKLLTLAMACPLDKFTIEAVRDRTGLKVDAMLCNLEDLRQTIKEYYPQKREIVGYGDPFGKEMAREFTEFIDSNEVASLVYDLKPLPPSKDTVEQVKSAAESQSGTLKDMAATAFGDPLSALRLLTVSNSAAYGFSKRVDNVELACALLGGKATASVLSSVESVDYAGKSDGFDYEGFWKRAQFCAEAAQAIAIACESQRVVVAHTAGLLHEIGRFTFLAVVPNSYPTITKGLFGNDLLAAEQRVYHTTHPELGYMLARKRNLSPGLTEPIRYHRRPQEAVKSKEVVSIVSLAARFVEAHERGTLPSFEDGDFALENLEVTQDQVASAVAEVAKAVPAG